ncbi:TlpA disulfide reductase family protein [Xanthobacter sp. V4C-4]|uniref:thiol:disulfide interchange protein TlpA n=1 Tax=Xanthobacter cornucopiae TaxID=3119924 RepID=UPI00372B9AE9
MTNSEQARPKTDTEAGPGTDTRAPRASLLRRPVVVALAVVAGAAAGALALYGMNRLPGNVPVRETASGPAVEAPSAPAPQTAAGAAACAAAAGRARALEPYATGDIAALKLTTTPKALPPLSFTDPEGRAVSLADFRGRVLLVNLWATWCVPCRKEMPELDHLEARLGGPDFQVVAINLDTRDPDKPVAFLRDIGVSRLRNFADPKGQSFQALRAVGRGFGLPTTLLVDRDGCELGFLAGPAAWGGADAEALVKAAIGAERTEREPPPPQTAPSPRG